MNERNIYGFPIPHPSDIEQIERLQRQSDEQLEQHLHIEDEPREEMEGDRMYNYA